MNESLLSLNEKKAQTIGSHTFKLPARTKHSL